LLSGKLWQGPNTKSVEDDIYVTPGSINEMTTTQAMNILISKSSTTAANNASPSLNTSTSSNPLPASSPGGTTKVVLNSGTVNQGAPWTNNDLPPPTINDHWGRNNVHQPPLGLGAGAGRAIGGAGIKAPWQLQQQQQQQQQQNLNRSSSWTPGDRSDYSASEYGGVYY